LEEAAGCRIKSGMTARAFMFAGLILLIVLISMFYSGMFMHGD
jgi:hypothetical protein